MAKRGKKSTRKQRAKRRSARRVLDVPIKPRRDYVPNLGLLMFTNTLGKHVAQSIGNLRYRVEREPSDSIVTEGVEVTEAKFTLTAYQKRILDEGYIELVEVWGSDERIIESARMSTGKGFLGWGSLTTTGACEKCRGYGYTKGSPDAPWDKVDCEACRGKGYKPGDEKLLKFMWDKSHGTPFEMCGMTIEVKAPIMVFREWHRHRTQGYNEMSARYAPLPDENYVPALARLFPEATTNKQAQAAAGAAALTEKAALAWLEKLDYAYTIAQNVYEQGIAIGVPKELARLPVPVGRYSRMRATANLRNWLGFMKLRCAPDAQWEIRQYANAVGELVKLHFPRTYEVAAASIGLEK